MQPPATVIDLHFCCAKIIVATSVCTGGSGCPPDIRIWMGSIPLLKTNNRVPLWGTGNRNRFAFLLRKNNRSHQCLHWWQQMSTGHLHLDGFDSSAETTKGTPPTGCPVCGASEQSKFEPRLSIAVYINYRFQFCHKNTP